MLPDPMDRAPAAAAGGATARAGKRPLLEIVDLRTYFFTDEGVVKSVDGVTYDVLPGETVGVVGESGCGKSVTALSVMRLIPVPPGRIEGGEILFDGEDLVRARESRMRQVRGGKIGMIFQEPMTSLNPVFTVGDQIEEAVRLHLRLSAAEARERAIEMLRKVGIPSPEQRVDEYPHQLSGGMRQRVMIAMALSCNPKLLIADEPTTALDVTIQAQILDLIRHLQDEFHMSMLIITHDLGVIAETAHRVVVMYAGKIAEKADVKRLFARPLHPYTQGLFRSIPSLAKGHGRLQTIEGTVPNPLEFPVGCKFHNRCPFATDHCVAHEPPLREVEEAHFAACWLLDPEGPMYDPKKVTEAR
jgi:peptide/nickel transport system ATP-binding protein/oligopeptide transport system ATP-binding protein